MARRGTILFFPWSHGVGFGYVGRALVVAEALRDAGYNCVFASDTSEGLVSQTGIRVVRTAGAHGRAVPDMGGRRGDYIPLANLDTVYGIARYYRPERIREHLAADLDVIDAVRPDAVVVDMHVTAAIAARIRGIPLLSMADSDFLRPDPNSWMPWLTADDLAALPYPSCVPAFNAVLGAFGLPGICHVTDLLWGDLTLIASAPELETSLPSLEPLGPVDWVGPVFWDPPWSTVNDDLDTFGADADARIYISLGHGGKYTARQLQAVIDGCSDPRWCTYVSLGFRSEDGAISPPGNCRVGGFTGIESPIRWSDVVVSHGGHATVLATLQFGRPGAVLPFMSEQEANGLVFLERQKAGMLLACTEPDPRRHFRQVLRHSGLPVDGEDLADETRRTVGELIADPSWREGARRAGEALHRHGVRRDFVGAIKSIL